MAQQHAQEEAARHDEEKAGKGEKQILQRQML